MKTTVSRAFHDSGSFIIFLASMPSGIRGSVESPKPKEGEQIVTRFRAYGEESCKALEVPAGLTSEKFEVILGAPYGRVTIGEVLGFSKRSTFPHSV